MNENDKNFKLLVVDDERDILDLTQVMFPDVNINWVRTGYEALQFVSKNRGKINLILLDKNFTTIPEGDLISGSPDREGLEILRRIKEISNIPIIMITEFPDPGTAVEAISLGASDYIEWEALGQAPMLLKHKIEKVLQGTKLEKEILIEKYNALGLIGRSEAMVNVFHKIELASQKEVPVLIVGETGTGKEKVARAIHRVGNYSGAFVPVFLSAIPKELIESELFGYKKGAFTGAYQDKVGYLEMTKDGILFLDEIGELPLPLQVKLLRIIEDREYFPIGSSKSRQVKTRFVSATNAPLGKMVEEGTFREDLYYRLNTLTVHIPPLGKRRRDIPLLADYFVSLHTDLAKTPISHITTEAKKYLMKLPWKGNVRELEHVIMTAMAEASHIVTLQDVISALDRGRKGSEISEVGVIENFLSSNTLKEIEHLAILSTLKKFNWDVREASKSLGIGISTLYAKIREYGLKRFKR